MLKCLLLWKSTFILNRWSKIFSWDFVNFMLIQIEIKHVWLGLIRLDYIKRYQKVFHQMPCIISSVWPWHEREAYNSHIKVKTWFFTFKPLSIGQYDLFGLWYVIVYHITMLQVMSSTGHVFIKRHETSPSRPGLKPV